MTARRKSPRTAGSGRKEIVSKGGILILSAAAMCACSGGSGGSTDNSSISAAGTTSATTPTPPTPPQPPASVFIPAGYTVVSSRDFGVTCDGLMDDTQALQSALNGLKSYQALQLPAGTCVASDILILRDKTNVMVFGAGKDATIIKALTPDRSAFVGTQNDGVIVQGFQVVSPNATDRLQHGNSDGFYMFNSSNVIVDGVKAQKVAGAGVYFSNVNRGTIQNSEVDGSLADAFHITGASTDIIVQFNVARAVGDDAFASIGYQSSGQNRNIAFLDNQSSDGAWAGGIGIEGTIGAKVYRNRIYRSGIAGIRIDSQTNGGYYTAASDQIDLQDNYLEGCVTRTNSGHGSIMMYANYYSVHGVTGARNIIVNPASGAGVRAYGISGTQNIQANFVDTQMSGLTTPFSIGSYATVTRSGTSVNGALVD